jgi:hypothetical protein
MLQLCHPEQEGGSPASPNQLSLFLFGSATIIEPRQGATTKATPWLSSQAEISFSYPVIVETLPIIFLYPPPGR